MFIASFTDCFIILLDDQVSATFALSMVISPALGGYISEFYGDSWVTLLATVISLLDVLFILFIVPESLPEKLRLKTLSTWERADPFALIRHANSDRMIFTLCFAVFLSYLPEAGQYSCFFVYLKLVIGFKSSEVALFIAVVGIMSVIAQVRTKEVDWMFHLFFPSRPFSYQS